MRKSTAVLGFLIIAAAAIPVLADTGAAHKTKQTPPVQMGTSGGSLNDRSNLYCCGGTLGALVTRDGVLSILSNNHVLARAGSAAAASASRTRASLASSPSETLAEMVSLKSTTS